MENKIMKTACFTGLAAFVAFAACTAPKDRLSPNDQVHKDGAVSASVELSPDLSLRSPVCLLPDNWWNLDVSQAPVDPSSNQLIAWLGVQESSIGEGVPHADFSPRFGIPYVTVSGTQPKVDVSFTAYADESDRVGYPIPEEAKVNPLFIESQGSDKGDRHLCILDRDNWFLYELVQVQWNGSQWEANCGAVFDLATNKRRPEGWTSTDAAGLAVFPGLVRYDEVFGSSPIKHALRVAVRRSNGYVWPASHEAGKTEGAPPMGCRLRMKASKDISAYPPEIQKIFQAMKTYGLIVADNGGNLYVTGTMDQRWDSGVLNRTFHSLRASDFEVIQLGWGKPQE
jgi:hypothetical protein